MSKTERTSSTLTTIYASKLVAEMIMQPSGKRKKEHRDEMSEAKKRRELHYAMVVVGGGGGDSEKTAEGHTGGICSRQEKL